jgi:hypothetical protein
MNRRSIILFAIFLIVTNAFATPLRPIRRQDPPPLAIKKCDGDFPNEFTSISYKPYPLTAGQMATSRMTGKITVPIEKGATVDFGGSYMGKQAFNLSFPFCDIVEQNGSTCPMGIGNFDLTTPFPAKIAPVNNNTEADFDFRLSGELLIIYFCNYSNIFIYLLYIYTVSNPGGVVLMCFETVLKVLFPQPA